MKNDVRRWMRRLVGRFWCWWSGHIAHTQKADGSWNLRRTERWMETDCLRCGKTLRAPYGLAIPNIKLGPPNDKGLATQPAPQMPEKHK
jgi:hypothetical protein